RRTNSQRCYHRSSRRILSSLRGALYPAISASRINIIQAIRPSARNARRQLPFSGVSLTGIVLLGLGASESLRLTPFHIAYLDVILVPIGLILLGAVFSGRT